MATINTNNRSVAILLPLRCSDQYPVHDWVRTLNANFESVRDKKLFVGVDSDDPGVPKCKRILDESLDCEFDITVFDPTRPAAICKIWATLAKQAFLAGYQYITLWGDDVSVEPKNWFDHVFEALSPNTLGCVAPWDVMDPSVPTFPIITRKHFEVFDELFDPGFVNQDADPYLFELYRRIGAARILPSVKLSNRCGGMELNYRTKETAWISTAPRYDRYSLPRWKSEILAPNVETLQAFTGLHDEITIDVVVPSFRTPIDLLRQMVGVQVPDRCSVRFIIIVDDPQAYNLQDIIQLRSGNVRVRVNDTNVGASQSRNNGLNETTGEWVLFLDDDVEITDDCLVHYCNAIRERATTTAASSAPPCYPGSAVSGTRQHG